MYFFTKLIIASWGIGLSACLATRPIKSSVKCGFKPSWKPMRLHTSISARLTSRSIRIKNSRLYKILRRSSSAFGSSKGLSFGSCRNSSIRFRVFAHQTSYVTNHAILHGGDADHRHEKDGSTTEAVFFPFPPYSQIHTCVNELGFFGTKINSEFQSVLSEL